MTHPSFLKAGRRISPPGPKRVLILGISGQDGSYLAEYLVERGHDVHGTVRRPLLGEFWRLAHLRDRITLHRAELLDPPSLERVVREVEPSHVLNVAGVSAPAQAWREPEYTLAVNGTAVLHLLEVLRRVVPEVRYFQASSPEIFGRRGLLPLDEDIPLSPTTPFGMAKAVAHLAVHLYRREHDIFGVNGILFAHASPRQSLDFQLRQIAIGVARIHLGLQEKLPIPELGERLDVGFAGDYAEGMWQALEHTEPDDWVFGSGLARPIDLVLDMAFRAVDRDWTEHVVVDHTLPRFRDVNGQIARSRRARKFLEWNPRVGFESLLETMIHLEIERLEAPPARREEWVRSTTIRELRIRSTGALLDGTARPWRWPRASSDR